MHPFALIIGYLFVSGLILMSIVTFIKELLF